MRISWPILFLILFFYYPIGKVIALVDGGGLQFLLDEYVLDRLGGAVQQALLSVLLTLVVAIPLALYHHHRPGKWTRIQLAMHASLFVMPVFVIVFGLRAVLGAGGWSEQWLGIDVLSALGPVGAIALAHAYYNIGFSARILTQALDARPRELEAAAATLGAPAWERWLRITIPTLLPRLAAVALLVFFFSFTSFAVVLYFGEGAVGTFETLLYAQTTGLYPNRPNAAALALLQLITNAGFLYAYLRMSSAQLRPQPARTSVHPVAGWLFVAVLLTPAFAVLSGTSWAAFWSLFSFTARTPGGFVLSEVLGRTLLYAMASAALAVALSWGLAKRKRGALLAAIPLGTSSLVLGFGLFLAFGATAPEWLDWRGSKWLIILAHTLVAFPFTYRILKPAYDARDVRLEETARTLGAGRDLLWRVQWPLLRAPVLMATGFSFAMSLGDFGASLLLMRSENRALSMWIYDMDRAFDPFSHEQSLAATAMLMALVVGAYVLIERFRSPQSEF